MIKKFNRPLSVCQQKVLLAWVWIVHLRLLSEEETGVFQNQGGCFDLGFNQISQKLFWSSTYS